MKEESKTIFFRTNKYIDLIYLYAQTQSEEEIILVINKMAPYHLLYRCKIRNHADDFFQNIHIFANALYLIYMNKIEIYSLEPKFSGRLIQSLETVRLPFLLQWLENYRTWHFINCCVFDEKLYTLVLHSHDTQYIWVYS